MSLYSMVSVWARMARERPDAPAISIDDGEPVTWSDLHRRSNQLARRYADLGVGWGDIVTVALPSSVEAVETILAVIKLGATPSPLSPKLPEGELRPILALAKPRLIVAPEGVLPDDIAYVPAGLDLDGVDDGDLPEVISPSFKAPTSGGSTGLPKLILAGAPALMNDDPKTGVRAIGMPADSCVLSAGPLYHNMALSLILVGLSLRNHVVMESRFDAEMTLRLIERHKVTFAMVVPTMMNRIWWLPTEVREGYDMSSIEMVAHNAAPCPPDLKRAWIEWLGPDRVYENYTATEQSAMTLASGAEWLERPGTVGRAIIGEVAVWDDDEQPLPPGEVGSIWMRRPAGTAPTFRYLGDTTPERDDRWHSVGDMGYLDEDGYLFLADRRTDLIISGGANIYPAEVEAALSAHPEVVEAVVIGLPDDDLGKRVHAIVQSVDPELDEAGLDTFMREQLTRYKCPRSYEFVDGPIRNEAGKVRRTALADERTTAAGGSGEVDG
jgi:bile acid-coenzyme A ligase